MQNFQILKHTNLNINKDENHFQQDEYDIIDIVKLSENKFLFYNKRDICILNKMHLSRVFKNVLPLGENILQVEHLYKDLIVICSKHTLIVFSTLSGKRIKKLSLKELEITSFLVLDKDTVLLSHKQYILKINLFSGYDCKNNHIIHRTKLDQPICKIYKKSKQEILIQTYYENLHVLNLETRQITKYYYYDLPSRLFTDAVLFKNDVLVSYSRGHEQVNRMNIRNGSNQYIDNNQLIYQMKSLDDTEQKYLIVSFNNGKVVIYERKNQREVAIYQEEGAQHIKNSIYPLKDNQILIINQMFARIVELEIAERNYCTFF
ncbi:hypothetical protein TTHERM_00191740 (macronuclear) [Tetrahymena thermophila SB210]|uniref:Uncharacterized protein n=1 Tax=Tetrahymena thermophila (strain SB210) TaxID=312017 RepID=I7M1K3_TETTS|nr:hypothetical protein TTHERM_00191740 [Tetrahymena thermophila SB210]EAR96505.2 hypothetical protein TTHERM_00191740 [Tetrahymena thermophila SB210]|eukprot:XP_001016750.2 hypothetical protein TTHERM_00191740 [Tetrahymena thermophila SB210]